MWRRHLTNIVRTVLTFVILNKGYSGHTVLSDCHVTLNVSAWSLHGSCLVSSTSDNYECYWILKKNRGQTVVLNTFSNKTNRDQNTGLSGICSFMFSMPKQEGEYRYFILTKPEPANPYSFDMIINGTDEGGIVDYTFWVENGVKFGRFTCNASSYFQDVLYIWTFPCQNELIRDKTSECRTSLTDQKEEITCIAINASTSMNVFHEGLSQYPKKELLRSVLIGCTVGMFGIMSLSVGIAIYLKRRKDSEYENIATHSTPEATDAVDFRRRESSKKSQEETRPQSDSDAALYNRLSFFTHRRPRSGPTQSDSPYNHLDHH